MTRTILVTGATGTVVWIGVQLAIIRRYSVFQPVVACLGGSIAMLLSVPSMRRYYRNGPATVSESV